VSQFTGFTVNVVLAAHATQPVGLPVSPDPLQQKDAGGTLKNITWIMDSCSQYESSGRATISFNRESNLSPMYNFRNALVDIQTSAGVFFGGMVRSFSIDKFRVVLEVMGMAEIIDSYPVFGAKRLRERASGDNYYFDCLSVLNENGASDAPGVMIHDDNFATSQLLWQDIDARQYFANIAANWDSGSGVIDWAQIVAAIAAGTLGDAAYDLNIQRGLASEICAMLRRNGKIGVFYANDTAANKLDGQLAVQTVFAAGNKKTVTPGGGLTTPNSILYDYQANFDLTAPLYTIGLSGRTYVDTVLMIKPGSTDYGTTVLGSTSDGKTVKIVYELQVDGSGDTNGDTAVEVFSSKTTPSNYEIKDILFSNKAQRILSVNPRPKEGLDLTKNAMEFEDDFDVWFKIDTGIMKSGYSAPVYLQRYGKQWEEAKGKSLADARAFEVIEKLNIDIGRDRLRVVISGFPGYQESGEVDAVEKFKADWVEWIMIPVTLEIENRVAVSVAYDPANSTTPFTITNLTMASEPSVDAEKLNDVVVVDEIRPIRRVSGFGGYSEGSDAITMWNTTILNQTKLGTAVKGILQERAENDGSELRITIPVELFIDTTSAYPKLVGDWIEGFAGSPLSGALTLPRRMQVVGTEISPTDVTVVLR